MDAIINALWELRTVFTFLLGLSAGFVIAALMVAARKNTEPDGPPTIIIPPVANEEPIGDMVDVRSVLRRYE